MTPQTEPTDNLTVSEAAKHLKVSERTLRRVLSLAEFTGKTVAIDRQTQKGRRRTETLPPPLIEEIRTHLDRQAVADTAALPFAANGIGSLASAGTLGGDTVATAASAGELPPNEEPEKADALPAVASSETPEVLYLRARLADALSLLAREQQAHAETRQITARLMLQSGEGNAAPADGTQESTAGDLRGDSGEVGQTAAHDKPRPFWAFWQKKEG